MQRLVLRWALWGCLFVLGALMAVGLDRFFVPPHESIPLVTVARRPPAIEYTGLPRPILQAEMQAFEAASPVADYRQKTAGRRGLAHAVAGRVSDFPVPSVTYLSNIEVYLVRTSTGFVALWSRDHDQEYRTAWTPERGVFLEPRRGAAYTMTGRCLHGPCSYDLGRYATDVDGDLVVIDLRVRLY